MNISEHFKGFSGLGSLKFHTSPFPRTMCHLGLWLSFSRIGELAVHLWFVELSKKTLPQSLWSCSLGFNFQYSSLAFLGIFVPHHYHCCNGQKNPRLQKIDNPPGHMVAWRKSRWKREDTERARNDDVGRKECVLMPGLGRGNICERKLVVNHQVVGWDRSRCDDGPRIYHLV